MILIYTPCPFFPIIDCPLSISSLRLLVPPLRLVSAFMWQVTKRRSVKHYGKLEDFVCVVTEAVPELLSDRQRSLLLLGLRAKVCEREREREREREGHCTMMLNGPVVPCVL